MALWAAAGLLLACSGGGAPTTGAVFPSENVMQLDASYTLQPGEERYQCFITRWRRAGGLRIKRVTPTLSSGVHHVGVFTDEVGVEAMGTRECQEMGIWGFLYGTGIDNRPFDLPAGTSLSVPDGTPIIVQLHLLNASPTPLQVSTKILLDLVPAAETTVPVGSWIVGSTDLNLPAGRSTDVRTTCTSHPKLENVFAVFPHMHRLGKSLEVQYGAMPNPAPLAGVASWNFGDQGTLRLSPSVRLDETTPIHTRCSYENTGAHDVGFGLHTEDEMCVVVLYYWPAVGDRGTYQLCEE